MNEKKSILDPKKEVKVGVVILNVDEVIKNEIKKFDEAVTEDKIVAAVEGYRGLKIMGIDDKDGYDAVHQARIVLKNMRTSVEQRRKDLKSDFLRVGRAIDNKAEELTKIIEPTEKYLAAQEKAVDDEVERLKKEAKEKAEKERRDRIEGRVAMLRNVGFVWVRDGFEYSNDPDVGAPVTMMNIEEWSDDDFNALYFKYKAWYNEWLLAEEKRKAEQERARQEEELARKAEAERLAKERAELEVLAKARKLEEEQLAKQRAEQERIIAEEMKKERERALAEQKKLDEEREKFKIEKESLERQRKEVDERLKNVVGLTIKSHDVPSLQMVYGKDIEAQTVHSGVVPVVPTDYIFTVNGVDVCDELNKIQRFLIGSGVMPAPEMENLKSDVITLIAKVIAHINKGMEKWQANQKSTKQTK